MPVTLSYDVTDISNNDRNYIRSMLERFHWTRLGGSVFRYDGVEHNGTLHEDWVNHIAPSIMFFRSFLLSRNITLRFLTVDATSTSFLDHSDPGLPLGNAPQRGPNLDLTEPTNQQSSEAKIRGFVEATINATV